MHCQNHSPAVNQWGVFEMGEDLLLPRHVQQQENVVWFITNNELGRFDTNTATYDLLPLPVKPELADPPTLAAAPDALWLLLDGVLFWRRVGEEWELFSTTAPCLGKATQLALWDGTLWMGGIQGVGRLEPETQTWRCYAPADGMLDPSFEQLFPTDGALWFVHGKRGAWRYSQ